MAKGLKQRGKVWYSNLVIPRSGGKRHVEALSEDQAEAKRLVNKLRIALDEMNPRESSAQSGADMSIHLFIAEVMAHYRKKAKRTFEKVDLAVRRLMEVFPGGIKRLGDITPALLLKYRQHWLDTGRIKTDSRGIPVGTKNVSAVNSEVRNLIAVMRWAEDHPDIKSPLQNWRPVVKTQLMEIKNRTLTYTQGQHDALAATAAGTLHRLYMIGSYAGLRLGEMRHLRREDIDLTGTGRIHVRAKAWISPDTGDSRQWSPKKASSRRQKSRSIPMEPELFQFLAELLPTLPGEWVMSANSGEPSTEKTLSDAWRKEVIKASGVRLGSVHTLRHCCATRWIERGENIYDVQIWLGHESITTTLEIYNHFIPTKFKSARNSPQEYMRTQ